ncbi:hypothetical protein ACFL49_02660 [Candidatus Omnitrophota bacterium]
MKKTSLMVGILVAVFFVGCVGVAQAFTPDVAKYKEEAEDILAKVTEHHVDGDKEHLLQESKDLVDLGVKIANHIAETHPEGAELIHFVVDHVDEMEHMEIHELEAHWGHLEAATEAGLSIEFDEYGPVINAVDLVVYAAIVDVALKDYVETHHEEDLEIIKKELTEVLHHLDGLE